MVSCMYLRAFWQSVGSCATVQKKHDPQEVCAQVMQSPIRTG